MSDVGDLATENLVQRILEQLTGEGSVRIKVAGIPELIPVKDAVSSGGVLHVINGRTDLHVKEASIIAVEVQMPMDLSGVDFSGPPPLNFSA